MKDRFFTQKTCDRCGGSLDDCRQMSRFNTDCLCHKCIEEEQQHPDYQRADDAELAACRRGENNFPGIGWTGKNRRLK